MKFPECSLLLGGSVLVWVLAEEVVNERLKYRIVSCLSDFGAAYGAGEFRGVNVAERGEP